MSGIGIIAGVVAGEAAHHLGNYLDDSDERIKEHLSGEDVTQDDIRKAVEIASRDEGELERIVKGLRDVIEKSDAGSGETRTAHKTLNQIKDSPRKFVGA